MPLFMCSKCGGVDNTALGDFWSRRKEPLCAECSPRTGEWHGRWPKKSAEGYLVDPDGYLYTQKEVDGHFKSRGPFRPVTLPSPPTE